MITLAHALVATNTVCFKTPQMWIGKRHAAMWYIEGGDRKGRILVQAIDFHKLISEAWTGGGGKTHR
jgi:hypothetical protein